MVEPLLMAQQGAMAASGVVGMAKTILEGVFGANARFEENISVMTLEKEKLDLAYGDGKWRVVEGTTYEIPITFVRHMKLRTPKSAVAAPVGLGVAAIQLVRGRRKAKVVANDDVRTTLDKLNVELNKKVIKLKLVLMMRCEVLRIKIDGLGSNQVGGRECRHLVVNFQLHATDHNSFLNRFKEEHQFTIAMNGKCVLGGNGTDSHVDVTWTWISPKGAAFKSFPGQKLGTFQVRLTDVGAPIVKLGGGDSHKLMTVGTRTGGETTAIGDTDPNPGEIGRMLGRISTAAPASGKWVPDATSVTQLVRQYVRERYGVPRSSADGQERVRRFIKEVKPINWLVFLSQKRFPMSDELRARLNEYLASTFVDQKEICQIVEYALRTYFEDFRKELVKSRHKAVRDRKKALETAHAANSLIAAKVVEMTHVRDREHVLRECNKLARAAMIDIARHGMAMYHEDAVRWYEEKRKEHSQFNVAWNNWHESPAPLLLFNKVIERNYHIEPKTTRQHIAPSPPRPARITVPSAAANPSRSRPSPAPGRQTGSSEGSSTGTRARPTRVAPKPPLSNHPPLRTVDHVVYALQTSFFLDEDGFQDKMAKLVAKLNGLATREKNAAKVKEVVLTSMKTVVRTSKAPDHLVDQVVRAWLTRSGGDAAAAFNAMLDEIDEDAVTPRLDFARNG